MKIDYTNYYKRDESRALMLCATRGLFGAHLFYLGHYILGILRYIISTFFVFLLASVEISALDFMGPSPSDSTEFYVIYQFCYLPAFVIGGLALLTVIEFILIYCFGDRRLKEIEAKRKSKTPPSKKVLALLSVLNNICMAFSIVWLLVALVVPMYTVFAIQGR